jgi:subtilisin family serine protease
MRFPVALLACALAGFAVHASAQNLHKPGDIRYVKGHILVQPRAGLTVQDLDKKLKPHGGRRVRHIPKINVHIIQLPSKANEHAVAQMLKADPHIQSAEVDQQLPPALTPNDPAYPSTWHLSKIGAPQAWDYSEGTGVIIAILDSGIDAAHPDLAANLVPGYNQFDNNSDTRDMTGHGTKVAGAAAMAGNNLLGGTGVSYRSRIMPVRVSDTSGFAYYSTLASGIIWAADHGARVASMSFRGVCGSSTIQSAAQYMRSKGGVVTGAAGNTGAEELIAPSDSITCASATDGSDVKASWSSYGQYVDVAAPGVSIHTSTVGGGYGFVSGTSFSAPITAAVYALMIAANPRLTADELDAALFSTVVNLGNASYYGRGRIDASAAVAYVRAPATSDTAPPNVSFASPANGTRVNGLVAVDVSASDNVGVTAVELYAGNVQIGAATSAPFGFSWDTSTLAEGDYSLEARAFDAAGNVGRSTVAVTLSNDTGAPTVTINSPPAGSVISGPTAIYSTATDDKRVAKVSLTVNGKEVALSYGSSVSYQWDPFGGIKGKGQMKNVAGSYTIRSTATDDAGNSSSTSVNVTVR